MAHNGRSWKNNESLTLARLFETLKQSVCVCVDSETCDSDDVIKTIILNVNATTGSQNDMIKNGKCTNVASDTLAAPFAELRTL